MPAQQRENAFASVTIEELVDSASPIVPLCVGAS